jgi:hypothetical protein
MNVKRVAPAMCLAAAVAIGGSAFAAGGAGDTPVFSPALAALNDGLRAAGRTDVAIHSAELLVIGSGVAGEATTLVANDRTHQFPLQFVENDPRRPSAENTITYLVDKSDGLAFSWLTVPGGPLVLLPNSVTEPELDASMAVWGAMRCNGPNVVKVPDSGADPDLVDGIVAGNPALIGTPFADITHAGWLPASFFNALAPNGATFILGVTLSFVFADGSGNPTDVDSNGYGDVAFREIYYNRGFPWGTGGNDSNVDIQTVAIHESGHAFGLAHFGKIFLKSDGALQFAPKAIMNAGYVFEDRTIRGTDNASFCQIWANSH